MPDVREGVAALRNA